jgi:hypothetical protein
MEQIGEQETDLSFSSCALPVLEPSRSPFCLFPPCPKVYAPAASNTLCQYRIIPNSLPGSTNASYQNHTLASPSMRCATTRQERSLMYCVHELVRHLGRQYPIPCSSRNHDRYESNRNEFRDLAHHNAPDRRDSGDRSIGFSRI